MPKFTWIGSQLKKWFKKFEDTCTLNLLLRNACRGWPNSQLQLAEFYLNEMNNPLEAYAWAELASYRKLPGSLGGLNLQLQLLIKLASIAFELKEGKLHDGKSNIRRKNCDPNNE